MPDNTAIDTALYEDIEVCCPNRNRHTLCMHAIDEIHALITSEKIALLERLKAYNLEQQSYEITGTWIEAELKTLRGGK